MSKPTAEKILDSAEQLFAERGFEGASLGEVANRVGIRGPSLYSHFESKWRLYEAVLERLLDPFFAMLEELAATQPSPQRSRDSVERMVAHHVAHPSLARLVQHAALAGGPQLDLLVDRWYRPFFESLPAIIPGGGSSGSPESERMIAMIMGFNDMILGHVTLAPLHERLFGFDPLAKEAVAAHIEFLLALPVGEGAPAGEESE
jgi:TetR/AcrR family transcriptional regulator